MPSADVEAEIVAIYQRDGKLDAHVLVDEARPIDSPLHYEFEWDDSRAAEEYRINQARDLIRRVKITVVSEQRTVKYRAFLNTGDGYHDTAQVMSSKDLRGAILTRMRADADLFIKRWEQYEELAEAKPVLRALRQWIDQHGNDSAAA